MPLYIRDSDVDALASELQRVTRAITKTEAVRSALIRELERVRATLPPSARISASMALADAMGRGDETFDMRAFSDGLWDEA